MKTTCILASAVVIFCICFIFSIVPAISEQKEDLLVPAPNETPEERMARHQKISDQLYREKDIDGSVEGLDAEEFVHHGNFLGIPGTGKENHKKFVQMLHTAFPDGITTVNDVIEEGDKFVRRFTFTGTHTGVLKSPWFTIPPSNKKVTCTGITFVRLVDGQIAERWEEWNVFETLIQLGLIPQPPYASPLVESGKTWE